MASLLETKLSAPNKVEWTQPLGLFIDNEFVASKSGKTLATVNAYTEKEICTVQAADDDDVDRAVKAASTAFISGPWPDLDGAERGRLLNKLADLMEGQTKVLATVEALDNGKPFAEALSSDVPFAISVLRYYAGWADKIHGRTVEVGAGAKFGYTLHQPIGVCGQIIPWNYPLAMLSWKIGPALACGNTVVLKLAEQTPLSGLMVAALAREAGFPPGVLNVVNGLGAETGAALARHPDVHKIAFTGSTATGKKIMEAAAGTLKKVTLETGGKGPLLVFEDADVDTAVAWAHWSIMRNAGQTCTASSRLLVHADVYDRFVAAFRERTTTTSILGDPFAEKTFQGPQVSRQQYERVLGYVETARKEGATIAFGGERAPDQSAGFFIAPTLFTNVKPDMTIYREEIFGPCVIAVAFKDEAEAVKMANDTPYGLGASLFTRDLARTHRVARQLQAGSVWVNGADAPDLRLPFGGYKQSGIGRELGPEGLANYYETKAVHLNLAGQLPT